MQVVLYSCAPESGIFDVQETGCAFWRVPTEVACPTVETHSTQSGTEVVYTKQESVPHILLYVYSK